MNGVILLIFMLVCFTVIPNHARIEEEEEEDSSKSNNSSRVVIDLKDGPESVVWVVQLSDLHFSVHHRDRALDFSKIVGPALSMINPSLVLITGDLTDGKSKDLLIMKQDENEWVEYQNVMEDVIKRSGLDKSIFYDLRGNHDNFGIPDVGGSFDFFSKYSINGQLGRSGNVNSITVENSERKHLFVGFDSTMSVGLRGPTNLFGHPTDQLLNEIDSELSQWNSQSKKPVTKISFGHFSLSFSASSNSGKSLNGMFLKHSLSAYLCGHLHTRFGKNLKRHHKLSRQSLSLSPEDFFQLNMQQATSEITQICSNGSLSTQEFWEWEMGDWRKSRAMRILAIDKGHVSFVDIDFKSGAKKTIILPTFPLDSRVMLTTSAAYKYKCQSIDPSSYESVRALVFSVSPIVSVVAKIYDSRPGSLQLVMDAPMRKHDHKSSRGDLYTVPWNLKAFEDPSPDRYWLQIEATDFKGRLTLTELRPISIKGINAKLVWTWKEFFVMGCQWAALYYPIFWFLFLFLVYALLIPKALLIFSKKQYTYKNLSANKGIVSGITWFLTELCRVSIVWFGFVGYLFYLVLFPWFFGIVFTDGGERGYMTYRGWVVKPSNNRQKVEFIGSPDIMVIVLPHLLFVILPALLVIGALTAERGVHRVHFLSLSGKKQDDFDWERNRLNRRSKCHLKRWFRKIMILICLAICLKHFKNCRALMKAYEMNLLLHFPVYSLTIPVLLAYAVYNTRRV